MRRGVVTQANDLSELEAQWQAARLGDGRLTVQPDLIPTGDVLAFVGTLPQPLLLQNTALTLTDPTRLEVTGNIAGNWAVPVISGGQLSGITVNIAFQKALP